MNNIEKRVQWIKDKVKEANAEGVAIAISGGIDSAVVAALAKRAFPDNTFGVFIGIDSSTTSKRNFLRVINALDIKEKVINLEESFNTFIKDVFEIKDQYQSLEAYEEYMKTGIAPVDMSYLEAHNLDLIKGNVKARLRMTAIYAQAQKNNYLVLETSNLSEMEIGYYTKWGDGAGDLAPITDLYKREVFEMAKELGIPDMIIDTPPSADLWDGQTDEDEMGFTYDQLEDHLEGREVPPEVSEKIDKIIKRNKHKRDGIYKYEDEQ